MLKIGDFSLLSKISIHMLRHYDEIGLLKPEKILGIAGITEERRVTGIVGSNYPD